MLATRFSSSGEGNGDHEWLDKLIVEIRKRTDELQGIARCIESLPHPPEGKVARACELVTELLGLIIEQILPRQADLRKMVSASRQVSNLDSALDGMYQSGQEALEAIAVYKGTLDNEQRQQREVRRSNPRYSSDQKSLQKLRREASVKVGGLLKDSVGFLRFISP
jgi:hypothetical protein